MLTTLNNLLTYDRTRNKRNVKLNVCIRVCFMCERMTFVCGNAYYTKQHEALSRL